MFLNKLIVQGQREALNSNDAVYHDTHVDMVPLKCNIILREYEQLKNELIKGRGTRFDHEHSSQTAPISLVSIHPRQNGMNTRKQNGCHTPFN